MRNDDDVDDVDLFVLLPFSMKGVAVVKGESCLTLAIEDGVKAVAASCPKIMAAIAQMQRVKRLLFIDLAMVKDY